jgi:hypothetical protein
VDVISLIVFAAQRQMITETAPSVAISGCSAGFRYRLRNLTDHPRSRIRLIAAPGATPAPIEIV